MMQKLEAEKIAVAKDGSLKVPACPIVAFIEGDGVGVDIMPVAQRVVDAAVQKAYGGQRRIQWQEVHAGIKATQLHGAGQWLPEKTLETLKECVVSLKGPLAVPRDGSMRSLTVALRQALDLYVCLRPVRYFQGTPSPVKAPEKVDMVVFRENSEDIYAGIEWPAGSPETLKLVRFLQDDMQVQGLHFASDCGIGIKPVSRPATERLVRKAIAYAIDNNRPSVTLVHKGNIMKYTEGAFRDWAYALAQREFSAQPIDGGPWCRISNPRTGREIIVKDVFMDDFLQQSLLRPEDFSVIATLNLNGDYVSDALAAQVGGMNMVPGANMGDAVACFEATHDADFKYAGKDYVNPSSLILSACLMLDYMGWPQAADLIVRALEAAIADKCVTYDLARVMSGATLLSCSAFGQELIKRMDAAGQS